MEEDSGVYVLDEQTDASVGGITLTMLKGEQSSRIVLLRLVAMAPFFFFRKKYEFAFRNGLFPFSPLLSIDFMHATDERGILILLRTGQRCPFWVFERQTRLPSFKVYCQEPNVSVVDVLADGNIPIIFDRFQCHYI